jgi:hypothetical protein
MRDPRLGRNPQSPIQGAIPKEIHGDWPDDPSKLETTLADLLQSGQVVAADRWWDRREDLSAIVEAHGHAHRAKDTSRS